MKVDLNECEIGEMGCQTKGRRLTYDFKFANHWWEKEYRLIFMVQA